ncbi:MAG: DNA-directed RNA polymerase subunit alpha C-terminal domain-containing protein, partial [Anaerolineae bacterium]
MSKSGQASSGEPRRTHRLQSEGDLGDLGKAEVDTVQPTDDIRVLGLEPRVFNVLKRAGIQRVGDLTGLTITEIESISKGNVRIVGNILQALARYHLSPSGYDGIELLSLSTRTYNALKRAGINRVGELLSKNAAEISSIPNIGPKA